MAAKLVAEHARKGMHAFSEAEGLAALRIVYNNQVPSFKLRISDWKQLSKLGVLPPWLSELAIAMEQAEQGYLIALLEGAEKDQRETILKSELKRFLKKYWV